MVDKILTFFSGSYLVMSVEMIIRPWSQIDLANTVDNILTSFFLDTLQYVLLKESRHFYVSWHDINGMNANFIIFSYCYEFGQSCYWYRKFLHFIWQKNTWHKVIGSFKKKIAFDNFSTKQSLPTEICQKGAIVFFCTNGIILVQYVILDCIRY